MDFSTLEGRHQPTHPVSKRRPSVSSELSSKLLFSRFLSFTPAGARLFCLGMLALLQMLPCTYRVGAVTFAFNGFQESDVYMVLGSPWTFQSNTSCFSFDPLEVSRYLSVSGRFLYPSLVQMKDPITKQVKSFSTTFIYQIQIQQANTSSSAFGPGMAFIVVPDNVTVGATEDYLGLLTKDTSTSAKNYESDNHTLGVELDTFRNPEFHDPNDNHIGVNLASMNSTFTVNPVYPLYSVVKDEYTQIWIDYFEVDSRMDIYYARHRQGKPAMPQGSLSGVELSLLLENMYIGFSAAKGSERNNVPHVYAWSFSNDGIPAPPIVIGLDGTSASPSAGASPPPISIANPPSLTNEAPRPASVAKKSNRLNWVAILAIVVSISTLGICFFYWCLFMRAPLRIFISHGGGQHPKVFPILLYESLKSHYSSWINSRAKIFLDIHDCLIGNKFRRKSFEESRSLDVGIVVITKGYFEQKWSMIELLAFMEAQMKDQRNRIYIIPLFYELTPNELKVHLIERTWEDTWKEIFNHQSEVENCRKAVTWLCNTNGVQYCLEARGHDKDYIDTICKEVDKILRKERSHASSFMWAITIVLERVTTMTCIGTRKRRSDANQRAVKEIGLMVYINKLLRLLFAFSGLLVIFFSVMLDNSFNDKPIRFIAFSILAPIMIFLGFLASGWFPRIPLWFIAFLKRHGFLQYVVPCSPWHDNVETNFCGKVCSLESLREDQGMKLLEFNMSIQNFLYGDRFLPQRTHTTYSHPTTLDSNLEDCQVATSPLETQGEDIQEVSTLDPQSQDFKISNISKQASMDEILEHPHVVMATSQVSSQNLQGAPSQIEDIVVDIDCSPLFDVFGNDQESMFTLKGPEINGFPLKVQIFKNMLTRDLTFDLSYTFRNKKTRRMNLTPERVSNLVENMWRWKEIPYPIVVDESSDILHCMAIQDILWAFTKCIYLFNLYSIKNRYLAGLEKDGSIVFLSLTLVTLMMGIIPLVWNKRSYWFLLFLIVLAIYVLKTKYIPYYFRSLFCPICMKYKDFRTLYMSKSSFIWCNEFRKQKIFNPKSFWIDQEYVNEFSDADSCFDTSELVILPGNPFRGKSFNIACEGWPTNNPEKQHDYELKLNFDTFNPGDTTYTKVTLSFFENGHLLGTRKYGSVEIQRLQLIEKLFYCYSNPFFGGYVETIRPCSWSQSYLGNCRRFLDICNKIIKDSTMSIPWEAATKPDSQFIIGVPF